MNDTQRLDALDTHGLCIVQMLERRGGEWSSRWVCHFGIEQSVERDTIRDAIDSAVQTIEEANRNELSNPSL